MKDLYKQLSSDRRAADVRVWETVKFFTTVFSALLSIAVGIAATILQHPEIEFDFTLRILIMPLPIVACVVVFLGLLNLWRENKYLFTIIATMRKIEGYFGILDEIPIEKRVFKADKLIYPSSRLWKGEYQKFSKSEQYIEERMKFGLRFQWIATCLFVIFIFVGLIFALLLVFYF